MDRYKKNLRSYRLIAPFINGDLKRNSPQDTTPIDAVARQNKYIKLHDEITKEADVRGLPTSRIQPEEQTNQEVFLDISSLMSVSNESGINELQISNILPKGSIDVSHKEGVSHGLATSSVFPKDGVSVTDNDISELGFTSEDGVLLDISNTLSVSHTSLKNMATGNDDNISVFSEIDNAYKNLIQLENCDFGSTSMQLDITTNELIDYNECPCQSVLSPHTTIAKIFTDSHDENNPQDPSISTLTPNDNLRTARPKKGRKRKHGDQTRVTRKRLCQTNKEYINQKGHVIKPRVFVDVRCNDRCHEKLPVTERETEFSKFWELCFEGKYLYISSNVKVIPIKRKRNKKSEKRKNTRVYSLRNQKVCAKMFIDTLKISSARIDRYLKKSSATDKIEDKRGKESGKQHKMPQDIEQSIIEHIDKFPKYQSHYCRSQTDRMYLPPDMTLQKMYDLYLSDARPRESRRTVSFSTYKKIFYTKFNLQRKKPQKDTCNKCDVLAIKMQRHKMKKIR